MLMTQLDKFLLCNKTEPYSRKNLLFERIEFFVKYFEDPLFDPKSGNIEYVAWRACNQR